MSDQPSGISINIQRHNSTSPRQSNLTSALQATTGNEGRSAAINMATSGSKTVPQNRKDSITMGGLTPQMGSGTMPISMAGRSQPRRDSTAGSLMNGMSWGGASMNSWIRDDIMMQSSSPFGPGFNSPSHHSSSYLPKLEANFMKDFTCCGLTLPSLHDLLQHYEEAHAQVPPGAQFPTATTSGPSQRIPAPEAPMNGQGIPQQNRAVATNAGNSLGGMGAVDGGRQMQFKALDSKGQSSQELESLEDMEMDDINGADGNGDVTSAPAAFAIPETEPFPQRRQFGTSTQAPLLDMNTIQMANRFQGMRQSQPTTPVSGARLHNNPTVSSVNTPTLSAHPLSQQFRTTPDSSAPGTPGELDPEFLGSLGNMTVDNATFMPAQNQDFSSFGFTGNNDLLELCIDDPAKRLFNPNSATNQQTSAARLGTAQYGPNSDIARIIREKQAKAGLPDTVNGLNGEEPKPFRCPVIGCEKAYKNQNGLKYHKSHGHNNQQLHENADGTFSIVDPTTLTPYPGTLGMEKEKPYKCEACKKRYKNLNGLKYHMAHSPPCAAAVSESKKNEGAPINASARNANVAGAGLRSIGEEL